jgi:type I restriction-modification system DNA methylase subunit
MELGTRTFTIARRKSNRWFSFACEVERSFQIPKGQTMGLCKRKGIDKVDEIFRKVIKDESADNKPALFQHLVSLVQSLPQERKPKQIKMKI